MNRFVLMLIGVALSSVPALTASDSAVRKIEERSRYSIGAEDGVRFEVMVIRWHLDHEMNSTALVRYASLEVAELRDLRLVGKYRVEPSRLGKPDYIASVSASDNETGRLASSLVWGAMKEVVTTRVISWGLKEEAHRIRAAELIARFKDGNAPNHFPEPTPGAVH
jgi:hypothetical protein